MEVLNTDLVSRSDLALIDDGAFRSLDDARAYLASFQPLIVIGPASCGSPSAQAAAISVATTAVRAFGGAAAIVPSQSPSHWPGSEAATLADAMEEVGATLETEPLARRFCILIGDAAVDGSLFETVLRVTWESWSGMVGSGSDARRLVEDDILVLAPLVAAGLAVSELFEIARSRPEAGERDITLNLWTMSGDPTEAGPRLSEVPASWWLVGLGHLGQGNAWALSWLPMPSARKVIVTLQDDEALVEANLSTSLCARDRDLGMSKARTVAKVLETAGYETRLLERRLEDSFVALPRDQQIALFGVDKPEARRAISAHGWPLSIDVGLGSGARDFGAISVHVFPGSATSDEIESWKPSEDIKNRTGRRMQKEGFQGLLEYHDVCGVEKLAGVNVAASFVGMVAGCISVSESLRRMVGGAAFDSVGIELWDVDPMVNPATSSSAPISFRLSL